MKFSFYKNDLLDALKLVSRSVAVKPMTPILSGIYLKAQGNRLILQSNDMSTGTIAYISANCERDGETVVKGKNFGEIIAKMPDNTVTVTLDGTQIILESGAARFELLTHTPEDFPQVKKPEGQTLTIKASLLKEIITKVAYAVAKDDVRPMFKGVYFEIGGGEIKATATNGARLAHFKAAMPTEGAVKALIPAAALKNLAIVLPNDESLMDITLNEKYAAFRFSNYLLTTRQIEGDYPNYGTVLQELNGLRARVPRVEFKEALDRVGIIAKDTDYNTIIMNFDGNELTLSARTNVSTAEECLTVESDGLLTIAFNMSYWAEYLATVEGKTLELSFGDQFQPVVIRDETDERYLAVITPVRT